MLHLGIVAACAALALLAGCGSGSPADGPAADVTITVRPAGPDGPVRKRRVECDRLGPEADSPVCRQLSTERLAPVPEETVCTSIYGGPAVARVTGTIRGERVDARFSRRDGCEIERWDRNRALLGPPARLP